MAELIEIGEQQERVILFAASTNASDDTEESVEELRELAAQGALRQVLLPIDRVFGEYPAVRTSPAQALRFCNGGSLSMDRLYMPKITVRQGMRIRLYGPERVFLGLALAAPESGELKFLKLFREQEEAL